MSLKKEFRKKDVERMRNLIKGKHGNATTVSIGYKKADTHHKEGDIWEEDGRQWTIKNGIKQNITKLDKAKKANLMPLLCPTCNNVMKKRNDKIYYKIHKMCFDCVNIMESRMMRDGKFEEYERQIQNDEIDNKIKDFNDWFNEALNEKSSYVAENGDVERWVGKIDKERAEEYRQEAIDYLKALKK